MTDRPEFPSPVILFVCANCGREPRKDENADDDWCVYSDGTGELVTFCPAHGDFWYGSGGGVFRCQLEETRDRVIVRVGDSMGAIRPGMFGEEPPDPPSMRRGKPS